MDELYRMDEAGLFPDRKVELLHGEIFLMPQGSRHQSRVDRLNVLLTSAFNGKAIARIQGSLFIDEYNLPEPDAMLIRLRSDYYEAGHPRPADVFLLVEISDSSLDRDLEVKLALYAISGIREYWIEDVQENALLVFRDPVEDDYKTRLTLHRGKTVSPLAFPDIHFKVEEILG